jgi:hypothetical protein
VQQALPSENKDKVFDGISSGFIGKPFASLSSVKGAAGTQGLFGFPANSNLFQSLTSSVGQPAAPGGE